ncbi:TetR/AcrR family transcriptional regulator [Jatrophihabitans sp.]|uniref:TetR/AcrR family transcriptional regulator n=1 Tax=Jatrophihabitans sp. TaxID=1932789 RepID=UPI002F1AB72B
MQTSARARVRDELTREIKEAARRQLAQQGSAGLSLRAVARELGMVSSAMYRYFPSRDDLLAALILDAHDAVASAAVAAGTSVRHRNLLGRWLAVASATRAWALAHPQEYQLIFSSRPGYHAPAGMNGPAGRIPLLVIELVTDAVEAGRGPAADERPIPRAVRADLKSLRGSVAPALSEQQLAATVLAWTELIASISSELFGHLHNVISDYPAYFDYQMHGVGQRLGLT